MFYILTSFLAGALTIAAPCILPLLPVVIGGTIVGQDKPGKIKWLRPLTITTSLAGSIVLFTLLIKYSTSLLGVSDVVWRVFSGGIVLLLGAHFVQPKYWEHLALRMNLTSSSNTLFSKVGRRQDITGDILKGAALGPVFNSCSPTYLYIVAVVLPRNFSEGLVYLLAYAFGLATVLLGVAFFGSAITRKIGVAVRPKGLFKKIIGTVFIIVGIGIVLGLDKTMQTWVLDRGWYDPVSRLELLLFK